MKQESVNRLTKVLFRKESCYKRPPGDFRFFAFYSMRVLKRRDTIGRVRLLSFTVASLWVFGLLVALGQQGSTTDQSESETQKKKPSAGKVESRTNQKEPEKIIPERDPNSEPGPINESVVPESLVTPLIVPFGNAEGGGGEEVSVQCARVE